MALRASFLLALNTCVASGLIIGASSGFSGLVYANTLPPITVNGPDCGSGGIPIFSGDSFIGCRYGSIFIAADQIGQGAIGGGGGGGSTWIPEKAQGSCKDDIEEISTPAANVAFKAYWESNLKPRIAPDGKTYTITFLDGSSEPYVWNQIIQSSYAINPAGPCTK